MCIRYTVNFEYLKTLYKKTIYIYIYIFFETDMFKETLDKNGLGLFHFNKILKFNEKTMVVGLVIIYRPN